MCLMHKKADKTVLNEFSLMKMNAFNSLSTEIHTNSHMDMNNGLQNCPKCNTVRRLQYI